ncbi:MAG: sulfatase [Planctomycetes bacterium]|nr:sulfatase [Planctomycetota bacterium]
MKRLLFVLLLTGIAGLFALTGCSLDRQGGVAVEAERPNVIFIFVDDQGYYDLGCYGATEVETPRIDALAQNGVRFTDYYAAAPICSPSRTALLTGCYPRRTGNGIWVHRPDAEHGIAPERLTIAELFKNAGYATACIGKWHLGFEEKYLPRNQGFDHYFGILHNLDSYEVVHFEEQGGMPLLRNGKVVGRNTEPGALTKLYTDEAITWIEARKSSEPFFLYLPHTMLHTPMGVSPEFKGSSKWGLYGDAIQEIDFNVGRIVDALERLGIDDETILMYVSDNGRGPGRNKQQPIRGSKLTTYEGGLRVPCIAYGPPSIRKGFKAKVVAHAMDWYPTLASLAGISIPEDVILDGRDLSSLLEGKTDAIPAFDKTVSLNAEIPLRREFELDREWGGVFTQEEYLNAFFYHGSHGALAAVRSGKWKLSLNPDLKLYDLENDPGERVALRSPWPREGQKPPTDPAERAVMNNWKIKTKLRGMVVQFQREMRK